MIKKFSAVKDGNEYLIYNNNNEYLCSVNESEWKSITVFLMLLNEQDETIKKLKHENKILKDLLYDAEDAII